MRLGQRGFTLLEMLVALGVATLLVSLVYGAVRVGQRSAGALDRQVAQSEVMRIGWQFVHDAVARAGPATDPARAYTRTGFEGAPDRLVFVASLPSYLGIDGTRRITLGRVATADGDQLLLTRERLDERPPPEDVAQVERAVLVERLDAVQMEYFGQTAPGAAPAWQTTWDNPRRLPNLVRIRIRPSDGAAWPVLIAAPQAGIAPLDETVLPATDSPSDPGSGAAE